MPGQWGSSVPSPLPPQAGGSPLLPPQQEGMEGKNKLGHVRANGDEGQLLIAVAEIRSYGNWIRAC